MPELLLNFATLMADLCFNSVSGGFAVVQPDSQLSINAVEGFPVEDFSAEVNSHSPQCTEDAHKIYLRF